MIHSSIDVIELFTQGECASGIAVRERRIRAFAEDVSIPVEANKSSYGEHESSGAPLLQSLCERERAFENTPLEWMYRYPRQAHLLDGASEAHKMAEARQLVERREYFWHRGR